MPTVLYNYRSEKTTRITKLVWSDDWNTLQPWEKDGEPLSYIGFESVLNKKTGIKLSNWRLGPLAVITGRYIPKLDTERNE